MRVIEGIYRCVQCGVALDVPSDKPPRVTIHAASGQPNVRVLILAGKEIHRCEIRGR